MQRLKHAAELAAIMADPGPRVILQAESDHDDIYLITEAVRAGKLKVAPDRFTFTQQIMPGYEAGLNDFPALVNFFL